MKFASLFALFLIAIDSSQAAVTNELEQIISVKFPSWDTSHDGILDRDEINNLIENQKITGKYAAASVVLFRHLSKGQNGFSFEQALQLAQTKGVEAELNRVTQQIKQSSRVLFLPGDPNFASFHQGRLGDCGLMAVIASVVGRNPQSIRAMMGLNVNGIWVTFPSGKSVLVKWLTDAELVLSSQSGGKRGLWLNVLEKAVASILPGSEGYASSYGNTVRIESVSIPQVAGRGTWQLIELFTGHKSKSLHFDSGTNSLASAQLRYTVSDMLRRKLVVTTMRDSAQTMPSSFPTGHYYALLAYYPDKQTVLVFNPWGNEYIPKGQPGIANGYETHHGLFQVPFAEFIKVFDSVTYETDQSANH